MVDQNKNAERLGSKWERENEFFQRKSNEFLKEKRESKAFKLGEDN